MESYHYTIKVRPTAEGGYWAEVPTLPGCFTQGETLEELTAMVRDAIELHLESLLRRGEAFPVEKPIRRGFAMPVSVRVPKTA